MVKACMGQLVVLVQYKLGMGCLYNHVYRYILLVLHELSNQHFFRKGLVCRVEVVLVAIDIHLGVVDLV